MTVSLGQTLGRYRLESTLGRGGMAEVFKATDTRLGRTVAVKVIQTAYAAQPQFVDRFLREARLVAGLEHPNILPVYDSGEHEGTPYLVMPFLDGGTLGQRMDGTPIPLPQVVPWIRQLADALDFAHRAGVLHRDVKPANVLVGLGDRPMLADFGIAKAAESATRLTATGVVVGTPVYMAPELALGKSASAQSDLYALAVLAYELLTGTPPFGGESALALMHQHVQTPAPAPSTRVVNLPSDIDAVFDAALAKDPERRPRTGRAFAEALASALSTGERQAVAEGTPGPWSSLGAQPTLHLANTDEARIAARTTMARKPGVSGMLTSYAAPPRRWPWLVAAAAGIGVLVVGALAFDRRSTSSEGTASTEVKAAAAAPAAAPQRPPTTSPAAPAAPAAPITPPATLPTAAIPRATPQPASEPAIETGSASIAGGAAEGSTVDEHFARWRTMDPHVGPRRLTRPELESMATTAREAERRRPDNQQAKLAADYAAGGLAYVEGNMAEARRRLGEVRQHSGTLGPAMGTGVHFVRQASAGGTRLDDWVVAVAYLDPRHEAAALLDTELRRNPADAAVRLARAFVRHLDGEHQAALDDASALYETAPSPHVAELAGEEEQHLGHYEKALDWYRLAISTSTGDPGPVAAQAAQLAARELGRKDQARAILADACAKGNQTACREQERFETLRKNGVRPVFGARRKPPA
ncbi:MAG: serine/threonine-protein kinase [Acidobacteriota bacterium]